MADAALETQRVARLIADRMGVLFGEKGKMANEQWTSLNLGGGNMVADERPVLAVSVWESNPWKDLWLEWFAEEGDPLYAGGEWDEYCFFCGERQAASENRHDENCIYLRAKQLIESETAVITTAAGTVTNG